MPRAGRSKRKKRLSAKRRYPHFKEGNPQLKLWLTAGLVPSTARALSEAGFLSLADLGGMTREQLRAIRGVGLSTLEVIEELLGKPLPRERKSRSTPARPDWPEEVWRKRGLPPSAAITFSQVGMSLERLGTISREELLGMFGVGRQAVHVCELLIGKPIPSRKDDPR